MAAKPVKGVTKRIKHRPLPAMRRWWQLPHGTPIKWPESASYSSLDQLLFNPYQWVLNYAARLRSSTLLSLPGEFQLLGQLAHSIVEHLYVDGTALSWDENKVRQWVDSHLSEIVREEAALLLMPGRRGDLESFRLRLRDSIADLHGRLRSAGCQAIRSEEGLNGDTAMGLLRGNVDLLVELPGNTQAVIDMKWAGYRKYRDKLLARTHIQLAIYAKLVEQATKRWPSVAYYILRDAELITHDGEAFRGEPLAGTEGITSQLWEQILATWKWRRNQVNAGKIEVVHEDLEPDEGVAPPANGLVIEPLDWRYNDFSFLAGWREGQ